MTSSGGHFAAGNLGQGGNGSGWEASWSQSGLHPPTATNPFLQMNTATSSMVGQGSLHMAPYSDGATDSSTNGAGISIPLHQAFNPAMPQSPSRARQGRPMMRSSPAVSQWSTPPSVGSPPGGLIAVEGVTAPYAQLIQGLPQYGGNIYPAQLPPPPPPHPPPTVPLLMSSAAHGTMPLPWNQMHAGAAASSSSLASFDQTFMTKAPLSPPPPPPPPATSYHPSTPTNLVPQQIRKRSPSRSRGRKRNRSRTKATKAAENAGTPESPNSHRTSPTPVADVNGSAMKASIGETSPCLPDVDASASYRDGAEHQYKRQRLDTDVSPSSPLAATTTSEVLPDEDSKPSSVLDVQESPLEVKTALDTVEHRERPNGASGTDVSALQPGGEDTIVAPDPTTTTSHGKSSGGDENSNPKPMSKSRRALEMMRAKLELAKQKKLALQDELRRKQQLADENTTIASSSKRASTLTRLDSVSPQTTNCLPPISALKDELVIDNISQTGPEDMVRFPDIEMLPDSYYAEVDDGGTSTEGDDGDDQADTAPDSEVLAARKNKLQQDLDALRQRLERKQKAVQKRQSVDKGNANEDPPAVESSTTVEDAAKKVKYAAMSKQELEKRKIEAQELRDVSYWRHYVSKQQHMLLGVTDQVKENTGALKECDRDLARVNQSIKQTSEEVTDLDARQKFVSNQLMENVTRLLDARRRLFELKQQEADSELPVANHDNGVEDIDVLGQDCLSDGPDKPLVSVALDDSDSDIEQFADAVMEIQKKPHTEEKQNEISEEQRQQQSDCKQTDLAGDDGDQFADPF